MQERREWSRVGRFRKRRFRKAPLGGIEFVPFCADSRLSSCFQSQSLSIYGRRVLGGHWPLNRNTVSYNTGVQLLCSIVQYSKCTWSCATRAHSWREGLARGPIWPELIFAVRLYYIYIRVMCAEMQTMSAATGSPTLECLEWPTLVLTIPAGCPHSTVYTTVL